MRDLILLIIDDQFLALWSSNPGRSAIGDFGTPPSAHPSATDGAEAPESPTGRSLAMGLAFETWTNWRSALLIVKPETVIAWAL